MQQHNIVGSGELVQHSKRIAPRQFSRILPNYIPATINRKYFERSKTEDTKLKDKAEVLFLVRTFLDEWVPKLYGIDSSNPLYREACICELIRHLHKYPNIALDTVRLTWYWHPNALHSSRIPNFLPSVLHYADLAYKMAEYLGVLPSYQID